ncbi:hypothetical protein GCM10027614_74070 [Micromonospora vulcania]
MPAGRLQNHECPGGVGVVAGQRLVDGARHRAESTQVHHAGRAGERLVQQVRVEHGAAMQPDRLVVQVVQQAGGQIVDGHDLVHLWGLVKCPYQVGADEAGTPGHHYLQRVSPFASACGLGCPACRA